MALTDTFVKYIRHSGNTAGDKYTDGAGMYLLVKATAKWLRMDYRFEGKRKTLALKTFPEVTLSKVRRRRDEPRELLAEGVDPSKHKKAQKAEELSASAHAFEVVAREWLQKTDGSRAATTTTKVTNWLEHDVFPFIGKVQISALGPRDVLAALRKMEARGALDIVQRVKQVCGQVFRYAVACGYAERDVTQDLKGALAGAVSSNFAAITEPAQAGAVMRSIQSDDGHPTTVAALKLSPLVFVRPGELRTAECEEIDLDAAEWRIPGSKMKMRVDHLVPLSKQAVKILRDMHPMTGHGQYVFPSMRTGERPMSENTINSALRGMGYAQDVHSAHGFRAMARTIMDEVLGLRPDLVEHQLAHVVKDPNGRAYNRTAFLPARRAMMQRWADFLDQVRIGSFVMPIVAA